MAPPLRKNPTTTVPEASALRVTELNLARLYHTQRCAGYFVDSLSSNRLCDSDAASFDDNSSPEMSEV